ncbi:branched-chain amino acid ABC transporter substrate-binding protein [Dongia sp.]|uniref:branched-chain amino acid ABC transporter substrate-binding protein n=1 Tax=Dongia sp. TaxID=1977262 RepID=UPI00375363C9
MIANLRALVLAGLVAALLSACAAGPKAPPANPNEITIAAAGPMTGDLAVFGEQLRRGAEAAVAEINDKGGVLGKKLRLVLGDDQCDPRKAVGVANDLIEQGAVFVDGHFCSGSSIPASSVYAEAGVLQMTPASTNPALTDEAAAKGIGTVMRVANRDDQQGIFAGDWIAKHYARKNVAVIDDGSPYGRGLADMAFEYMTKGGLVPQMRTAYRHSDQDFVQLIDTLIVGKVDVVYVGGYHDDEARILRQAHEKGLKAEWISGDALNTSEFPELAGPAADGVRFSDMPSAIDLPSAREAVARFRKAGYEPEGYTLNAYAAVQAFAAAATATGSTDGKVMAAWLRKNTVPTVIGDLSWDAKGDITRQRFGWFIWSGGTFRAE